LRFLHVAAEAVDGMEGGRGAEGEGVGLVADDGACMQHVRHALL
jgi:hypothetical protein